MWYTKVMKKKLIFVAVIITMCMTTILFGSGFGTAQEGDGTVNVTDSNRFVIFTSNVQFDEYVVSHEGDLFNVPASERVNYDAKFFETQALVMFLTDGMSGSIKVSCEGYALNGCELHVKVKELSPPIHTMDLRYNTLCIAIPREVAGGIAKVVIESHRVNM